MISASVFQIPRAQTMRGPVSHTTARGCAVTVQSRSVAARRASHGGPRALRFARFIQPSPSFVAEQEITPDEASKTVFVWTETVHEHG